MTTNNFDLIHQLQDQQDNLDRVKNTLLNEDQHLTTQRNQLTVANKISLPLGIDLRPVIDANWSVSSAVWRMFRLADMQAAKVQLQLEELTEQFLNEQKEQNDHLRQLVMSNLADPASDSPDSGDNSNLERLVD